jgi:hypothetical protein
MVTRARLGPPLIVALVAFVACWAALLPGVAFWDTAELQAVGPLMGTAHPTGFPTYVLLGWLASVVLQPLGEPAFRMNVLSAVCVAVAAGVTVDLVRALTRSVPLAIMAGLGLALTPAVWAIGTHAEAHALHLALVAIALRLLVAWETRVRAPLVPARAGRESVAADEPSVPAAAPDRGDRYLLAAAVVYGLAVGNHSLTLLLAIPIGLFVLAVDPSIWRRGRLVLACLVALVITVVVVYAELPLRAGPLRAPLVYGRPDTWAGFWYVTLAEQFQGSLVDPFGELPRKAGELVMRTVEQFGILAPLIPIGFLATMVRRPRYALLTGSAVAITCFFAASYVNADIGRYYLGPILMAWTWLAILAAAVVDALAAAWAEPPLDDAAPPPASGGSALERPLVTRTGLAATLIALAILTPTLFAVTDRFRSVDESRETIAQAWLDRTLSLVEPDAVIVSWWSYSTPLWYAQRVEGQRQDVAIIDDRTRLDEDLGGLTDVIDANLGKRPVYVIRVDPREIAMLAQRYELDYLGGADASSLTRVVGLRGAGS